MIMHKQEIGEYKINRMKIIKSFEEYTRINESSIEGEWSLYYLVPDWNYDHGGIAVMVRPYEKELPEPGKQGFRWEYFDEETDLTANIESECGKEPKYGTNKWESWAQCRNYIVTQAKFEEMLHLSNEFGASDLYGQIFLIAFKNSEHPDLNDPDCNVFREYELNLNDREDSKNFLADFETEEAKKVLILIASFRPDETGDNPDYHIDNLIEKIESDNNPYQLASIIKTNLPEIYNGMKSQYPDIDFDNFAQAGNWGM